MGGTTYSSRLKYLLYCNSTVFFADDGHREFWCGYTLAYFSADEGSLLATADPGTRRRYHLLQDGVNSIVLNNLNWDNKGQHLVEALDALLADETRAQQIAAAGRYLVETVLTPANVEEYWLRVLAQYSALMRFKPVPHPDAVPVGIELLRPFKVYMKFKDRQCGLCSLNKDRDYAVT